MTLWFREVPMSEPQTIAVRGDGPQGVSKGSSMCSATPSTFLLNPHHPTDHPQGEETSPMLCRGLLRCGTPVITAVSIWFSILPH